MSGKVLIPRSLKLWKAVLETVSAGLKTPRDLVDALNS